MVGTAITIALVLAIPQAPPTPSAMGPWLAQVRVRFGWAMPVLNALGLFSMGDSIPFRLLLSLLSLILLVRAADRAIELGAGQRISNLDAEDEAWQPVAAEDLETARRTVKGRGYRIAPREEGGFQADRWPAAEMIGLLAHLGPILLILGLLVGVVWGWRANPLRAQPGETVATPRGGEIVVPGELATSNQARIGSMRLYVQGAMPELIVSASGAEAEPLDLIQTPEAEPVNQLSFRLSEEMSSSHFAIPDAALFVRVSLDPEAPTGADAPILVQVFRIRSGEQVVEHAISDPDGEVVTADDVEIEVDRERYLVLTAIHDPGYWIKILALLLTAVAVAGRILWPPRRLWVRENADELEARGTPPRWLLEAPEGGRGIWEKGAIGVRFLTAALTPVVAGIAGWNLAQQGVLWAGAPLQIGITAAWILGLATWLIIKKE